MFDSKTTYYTRTSMMVTHSTFDYIKLEDKINTILRAYTCTFYITLEYNNGVVQTSSGPTMMLISFLDPENIDSVTLILEDKGFKHLDFIASNRHAGDPGLHIPRFRG